MACRWRIVTLIAAAMFLLGTVAAIPRPGYAAPRNNAGKNSGKNPRIDPGNGTISGVVEYARGDVVTVGGKTYDLTGARFQDGYGRAIIRPPDLRGWTAGILLRNGKVETVTIYRTLPR